MIKLHFAFLAFAGDGPDVECGGAHQGGNPWEAAGVECAAQDFFGEAATVRHEEVARCHVVAVAVQHVDGGDGAGG